MSNTWNAYRKSQKGSGKSMQQLGAEYRAIQNGGDAAAVAEAQALIAAGKAARVKQARQAAQARQRRQRQEQQARQYAEFISHDPELREAFDELRAKFGGSPALEHRQAGGEPKFKPNSNGWWWQ